jgi:hypothetical protein
MTFDMHSRNAGELAAMRAMASPICRCRVTLPGMSAAAIPGSGDVAGGVVQDVSNEIDPSIASLVEPTRSFSASGAALEQPQ